MSWLRTPRQRKKRQILARIRALSATSALVVEDETDLLLFLPLRAGWTRRAHPARVLISGYNARRAVFGCVDLRTGHMLCLEQTCKRVENFQEFLDFLREHYRVGPGAMLLDENPIHMNEESQSLTEDLDIELLWLPKRSPHLNPMDHLWRHGKEAICANYQYPSMDEQVKHFMSYYRQLSRGELLRKAGLHSPDFWLQQVCHL